MANLLNKILQDPQAISKRKYEHKVTKHVTSEFIKLLQQASANLEYSDKLAALFSSVSIENTHITSKKACTLKLSVARNNGNIFVNHGKKPIVEAYINPITNLLVREDDVRIDLDFDGTRDHIVFTPHHQFQMLGFVFASRAIQDYISDLTSLSPTELNALNLKPLNQIIMELNHFLDEGTSLYKNISEELTYLHTPKIPNANQFMAFADESDPEFMVTDRVSYPNPVNHLGVDTALVERFLDVFFEETDKRRFSWYMGAALRNIPVNDPSVSKLLMMTSARAGSGKSTLVSALTNTLFTKTFGNIVGDFDSVFRRDNRFTSETMVDSRMNVYLEADFGVATKDGNNHDFNQLNVSAIKAMITDGMISTEEKYESRRASRAFGLHVVLTNHPARITDETDAMRRRILPCLVKPTTMETKAKQLGLFGQKTFENWVADHALEFAVYFVREHMLHEYDYMSYLYNSKAFIRELTHYKSAGNAHLDPLALMQKNSDNVFSMFEILSEHYNFDLDKFIETIEATKPGISYDDVRISNSMLYINSSAGFWGAFSTEPDTVRDILIELYGAPEKKFAKNRFSIAMDATDLAEFREVKASMEARASKEDESVEEVDYHVVDKKGKDAAVEAVVIDDETAEKLASVRIERIRSNTKRHEHKPAWLKHVDPSTLVGYQVDNSTPNPSVYLTANGQFAGLASLSGTNTKTSSPTDNMTREQLIETLAEYEQYMAGVEKLMKELADKASDNA